MFGIDDAILGSILKGVLDYTNVNTANQEAKGQAQEQAAAERNKSMANLGMGVHDEGKTPQGMLLREYKKPDYSELLKAILSGLGGFGRQGVPAPDSTFAGQATFNPEPLKYGLETQKLSSMLGGYNGLQ